MNTIQWVGNDGEKTRFHKWYHDLGYIWCKIYGHNTYAAWYNDTQENFDHCRRCERYNNSGTLVKDGLNLWFHWTFFNIKLQMWLQNYQGK